VVDFVNDPEEGLAAFKTYHATDELAATTDPNIVFDLRQRLDAAGLCDDFEVDRVVVLKPGAKQSGLEKAIDPVADRLLRRYKAAQEALRAAKDRGDDAGAKTARDEQGALHLFKSAIGSPVIGGCRKDLRLPKVDDVILAWVLTRLEIPWLAIILWCFVWAA
jgi:type I restriction enzyme, R subunit